MILSLKAPLTHGHTRAENGVETDSISVIKNWRHTVGPVQFNVQDDGVHTQTHTHPLRAHACSSTSCIMYPGRVSRVKQKALVRLKQWG